MNYGKNDPTDGEFAISERKMSLSTYQASWSKDFSITVQGSSMNWRLTVLRTVFDKCIIYFSFISDISKPFRDKIKARFDIYISFGNYECNPTKETVKVTTTNICSIREKVLIHTYANLKNCINYFSFLIRGTIKEIPEPKKFPINIETIPANVLKNMEAFFMDQKFGDVTFQTADARISAHKTILAAQSPVFKSMFSNQMQEKKAGTVINLENVEGVVLKEMFRFIYGGRVENIEQMADKLLILANKYEIEPLMNLCEKVLYDKLTISNAISTIKIADIHNAPNLRHLTEEFIVENKKALLDTAEFKSLTSTNPQIVIDILKANLQ